MAGKKVFKWVQVASIFAIITALVCLWYYNVIPSGAKDTKPQALNAAKDLTEIDIKEKEEETGGKKPPITVSAIGDETKNPANEAVNVDVMTKKNEKNNQKYASLADANILARNKTFELERVKKPHFPLRPSPKTVYTSCQLNLPEQLREFKIRKVFPQISPFLFGSLGDHSDCGFVLHELVKPISLDSVDTQLTTEYCFNKENNFLKDYSRKFFNVTGKNFICDSLSGNVTQKKVCLYAAKKKIHCSLIKLSQLNYQLTVEEAVNLINAGITIDLKTQPESRYWFCQKFPHHLIVQLYGTYVLDHLYDHLREKLDIGPNQDAIIDLSKDQDLSGVCAPEKEICNCPNSLYYSFDGTCNNVKKHRSLIGKCFSPLKRIGTPICYLENKWSCYLPSAREVSLRLAFTSNFIERSPNECEAFSEKSPSLFALWFCKLVFTDLVKLSHRGVGTQNHEALNSCTKDGKKLPSNLVHKWTAPIEVSTSDPVFGAKGKTCMPFVKDHIYNPDCKISRASKLNLRTSFLDLDNLYGNDVNGCKSKGPKGKFLQDEYGLPLINDDRAYISSPSTMQIVIWAKLHDYIVDILHELFPKKSDDFYFMNARQILIYLYQHHIDKELLPLILGKKYCGDQKLSGSKECYKETIDPTTIVEFGCVASRLFHLFLPDKIQLLAKPRTKDEQPRVVDVVQLSDGYGGLNTLISNWKTLLNGLVYFPMPPRSQGFQVFNEVFEGSADLIAYDIQRTRDCCVESYAYYIEIFYGKKVKKWSDFIDLKLLSNETVLALQLLYKKPRHVELYVGLAVEVREKSSDLFGNTGKHIIAEAFLHSKCGDSFHYTNKLSDRSKKLLKEMNISRLISLATDQNDYLKNLLHAEGFNRIEMSPTDRKASDLVQFIQSLII